MGDAFLLLWRFLSENNGVPTLAYFRHVIVIEIGESMLSKYNYKYT